MIGLKTKQLKLNAVEEITAGITQSMTLFHKHTKGSDFFSFSFFMDNEETFLSHAQCPTEMFFTHTKLIQNKRVEKLFSRVRMGPCTMHTDGFIRGKLG